ncbi:hypothetical protein [Terrabacter sp. NPDC000476]|uniref:hypothetical protein n=1 Tax=Terrabacter sp. NPDC000476 TaxID=3154258 RepID=UPI0033329729
MPTVAQDDDALPGKRFSTEVWSPAAATPGPATGLVGAGVAGAVGLVPGRVAGADDGAGSVADAAPSGRPVAVVPAATGVPAGVDDAGPPAAATASPAVLLHPVSSASAATGTRAEATADRRVTR